MTIIESTSDIAIAEVDANEVIDTSKIKNTLGVPYNRKGFIVATDDGDVEVSQDGVAGFTAIPVGGDEPFVQGQALRYARVTENATITIYFP